MKILKYTFDMLNLPDSVRESIKAQYNNPDRKYHNLDHIKEMLKFVDKMQTFSPRLPKYEYLAIMMAILFHDYVYDPMSKTNEEDSVSVYHDLRPFFANDKLELPDSFDEYVCKLIMATKNHEIKQDTSSAERIMIWADLDRFNNTDFETVWGYTLQLFEEYGNGGVDFDSFKQGRIDFLEQYKFKLLEMLGPKASQNVQSIIDRLKTWENPNLSLVMPTQKKHYHDLNSMFRRVSILQRKADELLPELQIPENMILKALEELGELATDQLKINGYKKTKDKIEDIKANQKEEVIDGLIMHLCIAHKLGMNVEDIATLANTKLDKWDKLHIKK